MTTEYPTVTLDEIRGRLPELLRRVAAGERLVITDDGKWVGLLAPPPPPPPTAEEVTAAQARAKEAVKEMVRARIRAGHPLEADSKLRELFDEGELPE